jgi:hypothetical protein
MGLFYYRVLPADYLAVTGNLFWGIVSKPMNWEVRKKASAAVNLPAQVVICGSIELQVTFAGRRER